MTDKRFVLLRRNGTEHSTRGPVAVPMSWEDAEAERTRLKKQYPLQEFVILTEATRRPPKPKKATVATVTPIRRGGHESDTLADTMRGKRA